MNIILAAGRRNQGGRIRGASPKGVLPVGIRSKNRGIAVEAQLRAPFEGMRAAPVNHVFFELINVSIGTEYGSVRGIETLKKTVAKGDGGMRLVARDVMRDAKYVATS